MKARKNGSFRVVPFDPSHEQGLLELEKLAPQGAMVKMEIIRPQYLSRARLFEDYAAFSVLTEGDELIAGGIGAQIPMLMKGKLKQTGFGFDVLVHPSYRNRGVGRELARHVREDFFSPRGLKFQYTILRAGNMPMLHLLSRSYRNTFLYQFVYLTFPTARTIRVEQTSIGEPSFNIGLLSNHESLTDYYDMTNDGLGLWHTHKMYELKIKSVSPVLSGGLWLGNRFIRTNKYVPRVGSVLKTTTLFNLNESNIHTLPEVSLQLYKEGINYLQICCHPNDAIYRSLHKSALNASIHYIVSTQEINTPEELTLDVRSL